jgi:hypothetical protein
LEHVVNVVEPVVEVAFKKMIPSIEYNTNTDVKQ